LWNHFFRIQLLQGKDPYFDLPTAESVHGWQKMWFFVRSDAIMLLPMFTGNRPVPQPKWGYGVAKKLLRKLQPLRMVVQQLWQEG
jgi:hypothetical protein